MESRPNNFESSQKAWNRGQIISECKIKNANTGTLCWNTNTAYKHGHKNQCKIKEFIYLLKKAIGKYLYEKWPCMALIQNSKQIHVTGAKRGKTRVSKSRLV